MGSPASDLGARYETKTAVFLKENRLPGAAVGVVHGSELAYACGVGFADVHKRRSCDPQTLYRIASITKTFTATAIMQLRDAGSLGLDDPVVTIIPELRKVQHPFGPVESITIRRMLSHESGLQRDPPGTDWGRKAGDGSVERTLSRAAEISTLVPVSCENKYSNLSYQVLGEVVARVSGVSYPQYVRERILDPLGMRSTSFDPLPADLEARTATGYDVRHFSDELGVADPSPELWSAAGLWSCVDDLARWLAFQMEGTTSAEREVLSETTRREMHRPRYLCDEMWAAAIGIGWWAERADKVTWVFHGGGIYSGFTTHVCFDPKERVGAIAMINGIGNPSQLAMDLAKIAWEAVHVAAPPIQPPPATPSAWRPLLGLYMAPFGYMIRVEWRDGKLTIVDPTTPFRPRLSPTETADDFVCDPGEGWGDHIRFIRTDEGRVKALLLASMTYVRLDPVE